MDNFITSVQAIEKTIQETLAGMDGLSHMVTYVLRFVFPVLAVVIFLRCIIPLFYGRGKAAPLDWLLFDDGSSLPITGWENTVGSSGVCDLMMEGEDISRIHAALIKKPEGWYIKPADAKSTVKVGKQSITDLTFIEYGQTVTIGKEKVSIIPDEEEEDVPVKKRKSSALRRISNNGNIKPGYTLTLILLFQLLGVIQNTFARGAEFSIMVPAVFILFFLMENVYSIVMHNIKKRHIEPELLAFFLCGIGMFAVAATNPSAMFKQFVAMVLGVFLFLVLTFFLNNTDRARTARYVFAAGALALLAVNVVLGQSRFGARNWIEIGGITLQPSEFIKVAFVFAGASTLDRLITGRNLFMFIGFSGACIGALGIMKDFGTALIFFAAFLVIALMRSGNVGTVLLFIVAAAAGVYLIMSFMPYVADRFAGWRHAWDFPYDSGFQQARTMVYTASGGLLGVGSGGGHLRYIGAADTDLVFGLVAEEWGLIIALICELTPLFLAVFSIISVRAGRSTFYAIAACGASTILLTQAILNVFGSLDILPLTGVTLPFVSNGGSSMVACWGLLACIKSIDERHRTQLMQEGRR